MKIYVVYQFVKEIQAPDGSIQAIPGMRADEIDLEGVAQIDSLLGLRQEISNRLSLSQCTIINVIPLPLKGVSSILVPGLAVQ